MYWLSSLELTQPPAEGKVLVSHPLRCLQQAIKPDAGLALPELFSIRGSAAAINIFRNGGTDLRKLKRHDVAAVYEDGVEVLELVRNLGNEMMQAACDANASECIQYPSISFAGSR